MYEPDGSYSVDEVLVAADSFEYYWAPQGYWAVDGRVSPIEATLRGYVDSVFPGEWVFSMLVKLTTGDSIPPHCDKPLADGVVRRHLVLATNPLSWCMHDYTWQQMETGGVYTMRPEFIHAAINWGSTPRLHLVVDTK